MNRGLSLKRVKQKAAPKKELGLVGFCWVLVLAAENEDYWGDEAEYVVFVMGFWGQW